MRRLALMVMVTALVVAAAYSSFADTGPSKIRFVPENPDSSIRIEATFEKQPGLCDAQQPGVMHAAYPGVVEVGRRSNGKLYLVSELTFPQYLKGIGEVPRSWPIEALKAQVVAARTYAFSHMNPVGSLAKELNFNLCSTDACQVYRGLDVEKGAWGDQWSRAVDETKGQILEFAGKPADALYFSTSNGRTYSNKDVFGGSPLPYLSSVEETDDLGSDLANWSVRMPLPDLTASLKRAGAFKGAAITTVTQKGQTIEFSGGADRGSLPIDQFRIKLNNNSICVNPARYPTLASSGQRYPQVVPSVWMDVRQDGPSIVMRGRGWGHGVGMVQWGLKGKADRGLGYREMLSYYYGGLKPVERTEPGTIRIGLASQIRDIRIETRGKVRVDGAVLPPGVVKLSGGQQLTATPADPIGPLLKVTGASLQASPPVSPTPPLTPPTAPPKSPPVAPLTVPSTVASPAPLEHLVYSFKLSSPANVRVWFKGPDAKEGVGEWSPRDEGAQTLTWDPASVPLASGTYRSGIEADDGVDRVRSDSLDTSVVVALPTPAPSELAPTPVTSPPPHAALVRRTKSRRTNDSQLIAAVASALAVLTSAGMILMLIHKRAGQKT